MPNTAVNYQLIRHPETGHIIRYTEQCDCFSGELLNPDETPTGYAHTARTLEALALYLETLIVCGFA